MTFDIVYTIGFVISLLVFAGIAGYSYEKSNPYSDWYSIVFMGSSAFISALLWPLVITIFLVGFLPFIIGRKIYSLKD